MTDWFLARLREPSTHAVVASFLATLGVTQADEGTVRDILLGLAALFAALGFGLKEGRDA